MEGDLDLSGWGPDLYAPFGGGSMPDGSPIGGYSMTPLYAPQPVAPQPQAPPPRAKPAQPNTTGTMERPGAYESYWASVAPQFQQPWFTEQNYGSTAQGYRDLMSRPAPTFAADAYSAFGSSPATAGLGAYYDDAWTRGSDRLNKQFAARGGYNSSAATNELSGLARGLGAEQANREADYALRRAQTGGALAGAASNEASGNLDRDRGLLGDIFGAGQAADASKLQRLVAGGSLADTAQGRQEGRVQQGLENISGHASNLAGVFSEQTLAAIAADMEAQGVPHELAMGLAKLQMDSFGQQSNNFLQAGGALLNAFGDGGAFA